MNSRIPLIAAAVVVGAYLLLGWGSLSVGDFGIYHDDGIYAVTGRSLAETGEYRISSLPGEPFQRKYPVVFPALLAGVWRADSDFPGNIVWLKSMSLLGGVAFLGLSFGLLRAIGASGWTAAAITALCAFAPATGETANSVMSELIYGALSIAALILLEKANRLESSPGLGFAAGLLAGLSFQTRTVGLALVLAMFAALMFRRRWRALAGSALGAGLAVGICRFWQGPASASPAHFGYYVSYFDWIRHAVRDAGWTFFAFVPVKNFLVSLLAMVRTSLPEWLEIGGSVPRVVAVTGAALLLGAALISGVIRRRREPWAIYLAFYLAVVLVWPFPSPPRFFVPVMPLILLAAWEGVRFTRPPVPLQRLVVAAAVATFVASAAAAGYVRIRDAEARPSLSRYEWIRRNTAPGDVIACVLDPSCFLYTGRKAVSLAIADVAPYYKSKGTFEIRPDSVADTIRSSSAAYVMVEPFPGAKPLAGLVRGAVEGLRRNQPGLLREVWRDDLEGATIFRVDDPGGPTGAGPGGDGITGRASRGIAGNR